MMNKKISIIGVSSHYGQKRKGVDIGPDAIRYAGLLERLQTLRYEICDEGNIRINKETKIMKQDLKLLNLHEVVNISNQLSNKIQETIKRNNFPLVLGGDHSIAIGTLSGLCTHYNNLGVIWYDAHADLNTNETTPSGNIHGMPLAASLGLGDNQLTTIDGYSPKIMPQNVVIIGARSIDDGEKELIRKRGIKVRTIEEVERIGISRVMNETMEYFRKQNVDGVHLSFDLDSIDPLYAPGVGTAVPGGITYREALLSMSMLEKSAMITSAEFVEVNPILDEKNKTASVAVDLISSLLGETII